MAKNLTLDDVRWVRARPVDEEGEEESNGDDGGLYDHAAWNCCRLN